MVGTAERTTGKGVTSMAQVCQLLGASAQDIDEMLKEGRLASAIIARLQGNGVSMSPRVKDSVYKIVQDLQPKSSSASADVSTSHLADGSVDTTSTIMFTDIVGHTETMQRLGDRAGRNVFAKHDEIIRRLTDEFNGKIVKSMGDGFMVTFQSATRGVACAIGIQKELDSFNQRHGQSPIQVRIGLSVGEPIDDSDDLYGLSVIQAARISAKADARQIYVSQIVHILTANKGDFKYELVGEMELKGLDGKQIVYEVRW
jgi:class 3 adenylate cyclase